MENKYYQIYIDSIIDLASSIVIKCEEAAKSLNQWVLSFTNASFDELNPRTWKYYKNICGDYFETDERMYVISLDSLEEIEFSKESLEYHRATKKAYAFGTTYYKELVERYPNQEQLIHGILYPADLEVAIAAADGQILAYPANLVEVNEPSLIPKLQEWINGFQRRWHNAQYQNTDNLYVASMLGVMYSQMPGAIENIRLDACFTHEVHSYHVQQYLASHSKLDRYMPYLTRSQAMFFYHNLTYIENNSGREEIFDELLKRTFTERGLAMGHFSLMHSTALMPDESLTPEIVFEKVPLNTSGNIDNKNQFSLKEILDIEDILLKSNMRYRDDEEIKITELATYTLNPNVPTKLLQSTVVDYTDSERYQLADILLQHWLWFSYKDLYKAYISFTIPANGMRMSLNPLDAFAFYAYALCKGLGIELDKLPTVTCKRVQRLPAPPLSSLRAVCEKKYVSDEFLAEVKAMMPSTFEMISVDAFHRQCVELFKVANEQYSLTSMEERMTSRGQKEAAICRLWGDEQFTLGDYPDQYYADWFTARNIVVRDLTESQLAEIAKVILSEATGIVLGATITLKDIQRAMRDLLLDLSSYSIQAALSINTSPVLHAGFVAVRPDEMTFKGDSHQNLQIAMADPRNIKTYGLQHKLMDLNEYTKLSMSKYDTFGRHELGLPVAKITLPTKDIYGNDIANIKISRRLEVSAGFNTIVDMQAPNPRNLTIVPGMERFLQLPLQEQVDSYVDTWAK